MTSKTGETAWRGRLRELRSAPGTQGLVLVWLANGETVALDLQSISFHDGYIEGRGAQEEAPGQNEPTTYSVILDRHVVGFEFTIEEAAP